MKIELVMGGLRPGTKEPMTRGEREEILHHWREVERRTGQVFSFEAAMPEGFVYDTEPPCRAVSAVFAIHPDLRLSYFRSVQAAFYTENQDVTQPAVLAELAKKAGLEPNEFLESFHSDEMKSKTLGQFNHSREWGVSGFPSVVLQNNEDLAMLTRGYRPYEDLRPGLDSWLSSLE